MAVIRRVQPGEPLKIPAAVYNELLGLIQAGRAGGIAPGVGRSVADDTGSILVANETGADRLRFDIVGLGEPIILPADLLASFQSAVAFRGVLPIEAYRSRFAILQEPLAEDAVGPAIVSGVSPVLLDVTDAADGYADVNTADPETLLTAASGSATILWKETGTGPKWGIVRLGPAIPRTAIPLKLTDSNGDGSYDAQEQVWTGTAWADRPGAAPVIAWNLNETDGPGGFHVDPTNDPVVLAALIGGRWVFDRLPDGTADDDLLRWNGTTRKWNLIPAPTAPSAMVAGDTAGLRWLELDADYKYVYRADDEMVADFVRLRGDI